ncbi:MAG TPA: tetratricopeptide repeat protein [Bryobacteraceae bacterium]|jgi:tetratricopeptide (TPR) repeat protein
MAVKVVICAIAGTLLCGLPLVSQPDATSPQIEEHSRQAQAFLRNNRPDLAIGEFKAILALDPRDVTARGNLGTLLYFHGDYEKAAVELHAVLKSRPTLWKMLTLLGMCEKRTGQVTAARADLEKAFPQLTELKLRVEAGMELIELYYASRDLDKAANVVNVLRRLKPDDAGILYTAHRIYSEQADEAMLNIAVLAPKSPWMHELIAEEMARQGNIQGAITHYREALKIDSRIPGIRFELAEVLSNSDSSVDKEQAEKEYQSAVAQDPFDEKSECRLGKIAFSRADLKGAFAHYSRALELQPDDPEANLGLGTILLSMDQPKKAQPLLETAVRLEPSDPIAHYRLRSLYQKIGNPEEARRELARFEEFKQMKERLKSLYREMRLETKAVAGPASP